MVKWMRKFHSPQFMSLAAILLGLSCMSCNSRREESKPAATRALELADHHVHLLGSNLIRDWKSLGVPFSKPDSVYLSASSLLVQTQKEEAPALQQALLVPMAHLYGNAEFREALKLSVEEEASRVRSENDHVANEAQRYGERARALCAVNYLRPYAWEEIARCRREHSSAGVKLHLASAETDLRDEAHLAALARVAAWADSEQVMLLLHFDPQRRGLEVVDVERFIQRVLEPYPGLQVCIAHLGGSGGYGPWTQSVFRTFLAWLEARQKFGESRDGVFFELSAVILEKESEGVPATTEEEAAKIATDLRRAGLQRILFGSDYPVFFPSAYSMLLQTRAGLTPEEFELIARNRLPALRK